MLRSLRPLLALSVVVLVVMGTNVGAAQGAIRPGQHFVGLVDGATRHAVVYTVCAGPVGPGSTGSVAGGQTMEVRRAAHDHGDTGPFDDVHAWFVPTSPSETPVEVEFTKYRTPQAIPTSVQVPCTGTGQVEFSSCPYLAPCAAGWVPTYVSVQFENIAV